MNTEVYDAFKIVGVAEKEARAAAIVLSSSDWQLLERISNVEIRLTEKIMTVRAELKEDIAEIRSVDIANLKSELNTLKWMVGFIMIVVVIPLIKPFMS